jgi:Xaa-Pro dipeptidase
MTTDAETPTAAPAELRAARRGRVFDAMAEAALDALVLSRRDFVAYASGTSGLWTGGTRPFGAACVLLAETRAVHLLSTWDEGVPPEIPFEHLYGVTWNPAVMGRALGAIPGFGTARRIGVDGLSVGFEKAARRLAPDAELVPADDLLQAVRAVKLPAEVDRIRAAVAVAAVAVDTAAGALADGAAPEEAMAAALRGAAAAGVTVPASAPVVAPADPSGSLIHVDFGLLVDGYEGGVGRTVARSGAGVGADADAGGAVAAAADAQHRLVEACRPGATASVLRAAAGGVSAWRVRGNGLGFEPPVVTGSLGEGTTLVDGMVLSVEVQVDSARRRDVVAVAAEPRSFSPPLPE